MRDKSTAKLEGPRLTRCPWLASLGVFEGESLGSVDDTTGDEQFQHADDHGECAGHIDEHHGQRHDGARRVSTPTDS
ncbi:hypothetical protein ACFQL3_14050 [Natronoarchaeum sp. GCM10025321]|uniref:hypothetical protein n=1 Tax=Natronoarchaeum sp. GCM10025321 TaxID=3252684 RepID=UPI003613D171